MSDKEENGEDDSFVAVGISSSTEIIEEAIDDVVEHTDTQAPNHPEYITNDDWHRLLFQDGYINVLKEFALAGELQRSSIRSICWKIFLGVLPENHSQWIDQIGKSRNHYKELKNKYLVDPHNKQESSLDLSKNNPLSLEEDSPWNQFFQDSGLKEFIQQDIVRTHPEQQFFRQDNIQKSMLNILFCYAKENPEVSYRQGMHELLAPLLFVLHAEDRGDVSADNSIREELKAAMDPNYIEHDAFSLFTELMEGMQQFYLNATLESDFAMARDRVLGHSGIMKLDPRVATPFESKEILAPSSAIARKLDKIHEVILKRTDEQLYYRLQHLGIPPQTYGIRWLRLLFSREFLLPNVLELWDALFCEGPSLSMVDYFFVVMLRQFRDKLLGSDYGTCMQQLMQYPVMFEVSDLILSALHLRNPTQYPSPPRTVREWTTLDSEGIPQSSQYLHIQEPSDEQEINDGRNKAQKLANKTKQVLSSASKQIIPSKQIHLPTKLQISTNKTKDNTSSNTKAMKTPPITVQHTKDGHVSPNLKEMVTNPKARPASAKSSVERLKEQLENSEAKCLYCGRKMESILEQLQSCVDDMTIPDDKLDTVYIGIAGLKQIRDLLLHKLPFSGELTDYESLTEPCENEDDELFGSLKNDEIISLGDRIKSSEEQHRLEGGIIGGVNTEAEGISTATQPSSAEQPPEK